MVAVKFSLSLREMMLFTAVQIRTFSMGKKATTTSTAVKVTISFTATKAMILLTGTRKLISFLEAKIMTSLLAGKVKILFSAIVATIPLMARKITT